jgi:hypothetical protein
MPFPSWYRRGEVLVKQNAFTHLLHIAFAPAFTAAFTPAFTPVLHVLFLLLLPSLLHPRLRLLLRLLFCTCFRAWFAPAYLCHHLFANLFVNLSVNPAAFAPVPPSLTPALRLLYACFTPALHILHTAVLGDLPPKRHSGRESSRTPPPRQLPISPVNYIHRLTLLISGERTGRESARRSRCTGSERVTDSLVNFIHSLTTELQARAERLTDSLASCIHSLTTESFNRLRRGPDRLLKPMSRQACPVDQYLTSV